MDPNEKIGTEEKSFYTWKRNNLRFLGVPADNGIRVIDENGINYGGYFDVKSFNEYYDNDKVIALGKCDLRLAITETFSF